MSQFSGGFYVGDWFVPRFAVPEQQDWLLPLDGDNQALKETQNVEELRVNPEDMDELPQDIQDGANQWITFSSDSDNFYPYAAPRLGGFYIPAIPGLGGFYVI